MTTEHQIEASAAAAFDRLDRDYLTSAMSKADYDKAYRRIRNWCDAQYQGLQARKPAKSVNQLRDDNDALTHRAEMREQTA